MSDPQVQRTLVKSPPELWAEISDAEALARHLGAFGEIRITRLEPETTVVWEGDAACGTVSLAPSGWGTKVTLTAEVQALEEALEVEPEPELELTVEEPVAVEPEPQPVVVEPEPFAVAVAVIPKRGFFARLFGREVPPAPVEIPDAVAALGGEGEVEPSEPVAVVAEVEPAPEPVGVVAEVEPAPEPEPSVTFGVEDAQDALACALDSLGSAHHRPFSRG